MPRYALAPSDRTLRPRKQVPITPSTSARGKRRGKTRSADRQRSEQALLLRRLQKPLDRFNFQPPISHPTWDEWKEEKEKSGVSFLEGQEFEVEGMTWMMVEVHREQVSLGWVMIPASYYPLWRRLMWGATWFEMVWELWEEETRKVNAKSTRSQLDEWVLVARRLAAMRAVWYARFRRVILQELLNIKSDQWSDEEPEGNPILSLFIEFGIRDYRSWLFDAFEDIYDAERDYLELDPTAPENLEHFDEGPLAPFINNPPEDNHWLTGTVPLPWNMTRATFRADLLKYAPLSPIENLDMAEEGLDHMGEAAILWELEEPELQFISYSFLQ
ncbi:hypothetical protein H0H81_006250 [Sphagnurus paluster]|uniref:Uncharacterized protein n=1 Tax=Sphagnurus paluster TaxID=117069 RepID=A0A9P7GP69_9AGAR|nr:hypothetical protein H0H81_006250 [Sphagnurus paluster]